MTLKTKFGFNVAASLLGNEVIKFIFLQKESRIKIKYLRTARNFRTEIFFQVRSF